MAEEDEEALKGTNYSYRVRYPDTYTATGLTVTKFERDYKNQLRYDFVRSFPLAITSMPVSYEASSLLKCSVQMTYIRYILTGNDTSLFTKPPTGGFNPFQMANFNAGGVRNAVANFAGNTVRNAVSNLF